MIDAIKRACIEQARRHAAVMEGVLAQLLASGIALTQLTYRTHGPGDLRAMEDLVFNGIGATKPVRIVAISRKYTGMEMAALYTLYPDGRPEGFPELGFTHE